MKTLSKDQLELMASIIEEREITNKYLEDKEVMLLDWINKIIEEIDETN